MKKLRIINLLLLLAIIGVNGYIIALPLSVTIQSQIALHLTHPVKVNPQNRRSIQALDRGKDQVIIPAIQLAQPYLISDKSATTYQAVWMPTYGSRPNQKSNTLLIGHRFSYRKPAAAYFYNLDKLKTGDDILVTYKRKIYHYQVAKTFVVTPQDTSVEKPTPEAQLTLYTCTPLWSVSHRLVIQAPLKEIL